MKPLPMIPNAIPPLPETTPTAFTADADKTAALKPSIVAAISTVFDPEIPVNIWELGLIYDVAVDASGAALVTMTLTSPPEVGAKVKTGPGVTDAKVDVVWEPGWTKDRMSEAAKLQLGLW